MKGVGTDGRTKYMVIKSEPTNFVGGSTRRTKTEPTRFLKSWVIDITSNKFTSVSYSEDTSFGMLPKGTVSHFQNITKGSEMD